MKYYSIDNSWINSLRAAQKTGFPARLDPHRMTEAERDELVAYLRRNDGSLSEEVLVSSRKAAVEVSALELLEDSKSVTLEAKTAAAILAGASSLNANVLKAELGEGYAIALSRRWIVPDMETGNVVVNHNPGIRHDLEREAANAPAVECTTKKPGKVFQLFSTSRVREATSTSFPARDDVDVGGEVLVADAGQTYQAKVAALNSDGTYTLSFGDKKPANVGRRYRREELNLVKPGASRQGGPSAASGDVRGQGVQAATAIGVSA